MDKHIIKGVFYGDKYRITRMDDGVSANADKVVLSFHDAQARAALLLFANTTRDQDLARDIKVRLRSTAKRLPAAAPVLP